MFRVYPHNTAHGVFKVEADRYQVSGLKMLFYREDDEVACFYTEGILGVIKASEIDG